MQAIFCHSLFCTQTPLASRHPHPGRLPENSPKTAGKARWCAPGRRGGRGKDREGACVRKGKAIPGRAVLRLLPAPGKTVSLRGPVPVQARLCPKPAGHRGLAVPRLCSPAVPWPRLRRTADYEARLPGERGLVLGVLHRPAFQMLRQDQDMTFQTGLADGGKARTRPGSSRAIHAPAHAVPDWAKAHSCRVKALRPGRGTTLPRG